MALPRLQTRSHLAKREIVAAARPTNKGSRAAPPTLPGLFQCQEAERVASRRATAPAGRVERRRKTKRRQHSTGSPVGNVPCACVMPWDMSDTSRIPDLQHLPMKGQRTKRNKKKTASRLTGPVRCLVSLGSDNRQHFPVSGKGHSRAGRPQVLFFSFLCLFLGNLGTNWALIHCV